MAQQPKKRGRGRPPLGDKAMATPIPVRFPGPMMEQIDAIRAERMDAPDKGQIIRELVALGLVAYAKRRTGER